MRLLFSLLAVCVFCMPAVADANPQYKITPRVIDREVDPRDIFTETITVENMSNYKIRLFPSVNAIETSSGGDITEFVPVSMEPNKATSITTWIQITRAAVALMPGEKRDIPISFKIHQDAPPGNYQAFIGFGHGQNVDEAARQVVNGQAPGVIVTLAVAQNQTEFLKLGAFRVDRFVLDDENGAITYTLENPGEAAVLPKGEVIIYNSRGVEVGTVPVNPDFEMLAPGQSTTYTAAMPVDNLLGKYKAFLSVDYGTAQLASVYDTAFFYIIPWQKLAIIFVVVLLLAVLLTVLVHRKFQPAGPDIAEHGAMALPLYVYEGRSPDHDHDINLKQ